MFIELAESGGLSIAFIVYIDYQLSRLLIAQWTHSLLLFWLQMS